MQLALLIANHSAQTLCLSADLVERFGVPQHQRERYEDLAGCIDGADSVRACGKLTSECYGFGDIGIKDGGFFPSVP